MPKRNAIPSWGPTDYARASRALRLYEGFARGVVACEFPTWSVDKSEVFRNRVLRATDIDEALDTTPLRIESEPEAVLAELSRLGAKKIPSCLSAHIANAPRPEATVAPDDPGLLRAERRVAALEDELRGLRAKLKASFKRESFGEAIAEVIREATTPLPAVGAPALVKSLSKSVTPVDAVAMLSDEHADEIVSVASSWGMEDFDFDIYRARLQRWAERMVGWVVKGGWLPAHRFERIVVGKLGDAINGAIHDAEFRNHFANSTRAALATGDAEAHALQFIYRETGIPIEVIALSGNHPRTTTRKDYHDPHMNLDFLVGTQIATRLDGHDAIRVHVPRSYSAFVEVRGHLFALNHGDDVRGSSFGIPWYGFTRRNTRVQAMTAAVGERVSFFLYGHYHSRASIPTAGAQSYHNGAFPATGGYALESLSAGNEPAQTLLVVDERHGVQQEIPIYLRDRDREAKVRSGEWTSDFGAKTILDTVDAGSTRRPTGLVTLG